MKTLMDLNVKDLNLRQCNSILNNKIRILGNNELKDQYETFIKRVVDRKVELSTPKVIKKAPPTIQAKKIARETEEQRRKREQLQLNATITDLITDRKEAPQLKTGYTPFSQLKENKPKQQTQQRIKLNKEKIEARINIIKRTLKRNPHRNVVKLMNEHKLYQPTISKHEYSQALNELKEYKASLS